MKNFIKNDNGELLGTWMHKEGGHIVEATAYRLVNGLVKGITMDFDETRSPLMNRNRACRWILVTSA